MPICLYVKHPSRCPKAESSVSSLTTGKSCCTPTTMLSWHGQRRTLFADNFAVATAALSASARSAEIARYLAVPIMASHKMGDVRFPAEADHICSLRGLRLLTKAAEVPFFCCCPKGQ